MNAVVLPQPLACLTDIGELLAFPGVPSQNNQKQISGEADVLIRGVASVLDQLIVSVIEKRTAADFIATRDAVFSKYFFGVRAIADLARIVVPQHMIDVLVSQYFNEMESDFRHKGLSAFGAAVRDQALFTIWTMRKISELCSRINEAKIPDTLTNEDQQISLQFAYYAIYSRFHLQCLETSMRFQKALYPEVVDAVIDGLRAVVNAYALARRGLDLRLPSTELLMAPVEWDDEEQSLLDEATNDLINETE